MRRSRETSNLSQICARTLILMNQSQAGAAQPKAARCQVAFQRNHHKGLFFFCDSTGPGLGSPPAICFVFSTPSLCHNIMGGMPMKITCTISPVDKDHTEYCWLQSDIYSSVFLLLSFAARETDRRATVPPGGGNMTQVCLRVCLGDFRFLYLNSNQSVFFFPVDGKEKRKTKYHTLAVITDTLERDDESFASSFLMEYIK